jgi:hypothetical protein
MSFFAVLTWTYCPLFYTTHIWFSLWVLPIRPFGRFASVSMAHQWVYLLLLFYSCQHDFFSSSFFSSICHSASFILNSASFICHSASKNGRLNHTVFFFNANAIGIKIMVRHRIIKVIQQRRAIK